MATRGELAASIQRIRRPRRCAIAWCARAMRLWIWCASKKPEMIAGPCSHGYSRGTCSQYPADTKTAAMRYSVVRQSDETLDLVCIEEAGDDSRALQPWLLAGNLQPVSSGYEDRGDAL